MLFIKERNNLIMVQGVWWLNGGATDSMGSKPVYAELTKSMKRWLRPDMTETHLGGALTMK